MYIYQSNKSNCSLQAHLVLQAFSTICKLQSGEAHLNLEASSTRGSTEHCCWDRLNGEGLLSPARERDGRMWLASAFFHLTSAATTTSAAAASSTSSLSFVSHTLAPRALLVGTCCGRGKRSPRPQRASPTTIGVRPLSKRFLATPSAAGGRWGGNMVVPEDAASLLRSVYAAKPTPQIVLANTG